MKFIISILLTALLAFAVGLQLPWWAISIAACVVAFAVPQKAFKSWLVGFIALFLLWAGLAIYANANGSQLMSNQIASILPLKGNTTILIVVTAFIGGLVGGFGALTGSLGRKLFSKAK